MRHWQIRYAKLFAAFALAVLIAAGHGWAQTDAADVPATGETAASVANAATDEDAVIETVQGEPEVADEAGEPAAGDVSGTMAADPPDDPRDLLQWIEKGAEIKGLIESGGGMTALVAFPNGLSSILKKGSEVPELGVIVRDISDEGVIVELKDPIEGVAAKDQRAVIRP